MKSSFLQQYNIGLAQLTQKEYDFDFVFDDAIFSHFSCQILEKGEGKCHIALKKTSNLITLHFSIHGKVILTCDRSLEEYEHPIHIEKDVIYKVGDENKELDEDTFMIARDAADTINILQNLYEYIILSVPLKKLHPRYQNQEESNDEVLVYQSDAETEISEDPRWSVLKKISNN